MCLGNNVYSTEYDEGGDKWQDAADLLEFTHPLIWIGRGCVGWWWWWWWWVRWVGGVWLGLPLWACGRVVARASAHTKSTE